MIGGFKPNTQKKVNWRSVHVTESKIEALQYSLQYEGSFMSSFVSNNKLFFHVFAPSKTTYGRLSCRCLTCLTRGVLERNEPGKYGSVSDRATSSTKETGRTRRETPQCFVHTHKCVCTVRREVLVKPPPCFARRRRDLHGPQSDDLRGTTKEPSPGPCVS
jgi:hypothetical protein